MKPNSNMMNSFLVTMGSYLSVVSANSRSHCVGTCYSGRFLPEPQDIFHGKHLKGYSYNNITTDDPVKCYSSCVQDCRCKACQMKDARCELLDEDKTSKTLRDEPGYVHFDLKQTMYQGESHMVPTGVCYNGCCRSQPCMNGGTCVERCESPKEKFTCTCPFLFSGKVCEKTPDSCLGILKSAPGGILPKDGVYTVTSKQTDEIQTRPIYCDFEVPNIAWTLIESFSRDMNDKYKFKAFHQAYAQNKERPPDSHWDDFRVGPLLMKQIHDDNSTMFRATCNFPNRKGDLTSDYVLGYLSDFDIITEGDLQRACKRFSYMNIRNQEFYNATVPIWHKKDVCHLHIGYPTTISPPLCGFEPLQDALRGECSFGFYDFYHPQFKCVETENSTTQWWLGGEK